MGLRKRKRLEMGVRFEYLRDPARINGLVKARLLETDAERLQPACGYMSRRKRGDRGRIDAPAKEHADRHVCHQTAPHGIIQARSKLLAPCALGIRRNLAPGERLEDKVPVLLDTRRQLGRLDVENERVAPRQLVDVLQDRVWGGDVAVAEIFLERPARQRGTDGRVGAEGRQLGTKNECAILRGVEKGLLSEAVAASEEAAADAVVDDESPHAVAPAGQSGTPFAIAVEQHLGVGVVRLKPVAAGDELGAKLGKIVNLPVENDDKVAVGSDHRLVTSGDIKDGKAEVAVGSDHRLVTSGDIKDGKAAVAELN